MVQASAVVPNSFMLRGAKKARQHLRGGEKQCNKREREAGNDEETARNGGGKEAAITTTTRCGTRMIKQGSRFRRIDECEAEHIEVKWAPSTAATAVAVLRNGRGLAFGERLQSEADDGAGG